MELSDSQKENAQDAADRVPLFKTAIGAAAWSAMPRTYREVHDVRDRHVLKGQARVTRGRGLLARLIAAAFQFPPEREATPLTVTMTRDGDTEIWVRDFDGQRFSSVLSQAGQGQITERFGPFSFKLALPVSNGRMRMDVMRGWCLGVPMPRMLLPGSDTEEFERDGVFRFDVRLTAPLAGLIVHYQGWLVRDP